MEGNAEVKQKKSIFENPLLSTKVKSANAKIFPEGALGYFIGPTLALLANSILANYFNKYMSDILDIPTWADWFFNWLPVVSVIFVVLGNILVGRLMDHSRTKAGKARPLLLLSIPLSVIALLFLFVFTPFATTMENGVATLVLIAIGYNLWFAIAYPMYYTPHAGLVNLSTRSGKDRSLLATISNATALAAMGLCTMILPFFLGLLFVNQMDVSVLNSAQYQFYIANFNEAGTQIINYTQVTPILDAVEITKDAFITTANTITPEAFLALTGLVAVPQFADTGVLTSFSNQYGNAIIDQQASYNNWKIFVIALIVITAIGALIEYYFTRERVTEEQFSINTNVVKKATPIKQQAKICLKDKFWWIMIAFFFLYQLGGMVKNVSQLYYCSAMFGQESGGTTLYSTAIGGSFSGTIAIIGAIPTAIGMVIAWPLSNKIGKGKAILFGAIVSVIGGAIGLVGDIFMPGNFILICVSFAVKALGSTPAMYLSLALLADMLDHQEAIHGVRTDGFTMTIYGAIMAGMTGIATGVLNITLTASGYTANSVSNAALRASMPWIFIGVETICYLLIAIIFIFMFVEKYSKFDHKAIAQDQKAQAEADGVEYIDPAEKLKLEEAEADAKVEEAKRAELKAKCEKKGLNYEEELAKYEKTLADKQAAADAKKEAADKKKAEAEAAKQAKFDALSDAEKAAIEQKKQAKAEKQAKHDAAVLEEFNKLREANGRPVLSAEE